MKFSDLPKNIRLEWINSFLKTRAKKKKLEKKLFREWFDKNYKPKVAEPASLLEVKLKE